MSMRVNGVVTALPGSQSFNIIVEGTEKMTDAERKTLAEFQRKVSNLQRSVNAASGVANETAASISLLKRAAAEAPVDNKRLIDQAAAFENEVRAILHELRGGRANSDIPPPSISTRINTVANTIRLSTITLTKTQLEQFALSDSEFKPVLARLKKLVEVDIPAFEKQLEAAGAPLTPGRLP